MSTSSPIDIDYVANLARIALSEEERSLFSEQLGEVLEYIEQLKTVDVEGVVPTAHAFPVTNVWRADVVYPGLTQDEALGNAPEARDGMFVVPKVVE
jgi:aspartyl-tRNA(Asn)/glutamyl-tRNA(Gln) amidotransferase subunit C